MTTVARAFANSRFCLLLLGMEYSCSNVNELPSALQDNTRSQSFSPDSITKVSSLSLFFRETFDDVESCDCRGCDIFFSLGTSPFEGLLKQGSSFGAGRIAALVLYWKASFRRFSCLQRF